MRNPRRPRSARGATTVQYALIVLFIGLFVVTPIVAIARSIGGTTTAVDAGLAGQPVYSSDFASYQQAGGSSYQSGGSASGAPTFDPATAVLFDSVENQTGNWNWVRIWLESCCGNAWDWSGWSSNLWSATAPPAVNNTAYTASLPVPTFVTTGRTDWQDIDARMYTTATTGAIPGIHIRVSADGSQWVRCYLNETNLASAQISIDYNDSTGYHYKVSSSPTAMTAGQNYFLQIGVTGNSYGCELMNSSGTWLASTSTTITASNPNDLTSGQAGMSNDGNATAAAPLYGNTDWAFLVWEHNGPAGNRGTPSYWDKWWWYNNSAPSFSYVNQPGYQSAHSLSIYNATPNTTSFWATEGPNGCGEPCAFAIQPSTTYRVSAYVKASGFTPGSGNGSNFGMTGCLLDFGQFQSQTWNSPSWLGEAAVASAPATATSWTFIQGTVTTNATAHYGTLRLVTSGVGTCNFDVLEIIHPQ